MAGGELWDANVELERNLFGNAIIAKVVWAIDGSKTNGPPESFEMGGKEDQLKLDAEIAKLG